MTKAPRNQTVGSVPGRTPEEFLEDNDVPPGHSPDTAPTDNLADPEPVKHAALEESLDPPKVYKLLSADATINGEKYSTHFPDHGGHYGLLALTEKQADAVMADGWKIVELGGEDDFSVHPEAEEKDARYKASDKKVGV
jgi:hypothetical protein